MIRTLRTAFLLLMMLVPPIVANGQVHSTPLDPKEKSQSVRIANDTRLPPELETTLDGARPNPFCDETTIAFALPERRTVRVTVRSLMGEPVRDLFEGELEAGIQAVVWNGRDNEGRPAPSGLYLYTVDDGLTVGSNPIVLVRE